MRWRKSLLALAVALLTLAASEGGYRAWLGLRGRPYETAAAREELAALLDFARNFGEEAAVPSGEPGFHRYSGSDVLHPFFGFDHPEGAVQVAADLASVRKSSSELRILVLGGSVAAAFQNLGTPRLRELLGEDPRLQGRSLRFLKYARASFKQPQQLMTVAYLLSMGIAPDVVIDIDGFNEVAIGNYNCSHGTNPVHPSHDKWLTLAAEKAADPESAELEVRLRARREELLERAEAMEESPLLGSAILGRSILGRLRGLRNELAREQEAYLDLLQERELPAHLFGPPFEGDERRALELIARHWMESSYSIQLLCSARSILYLHVLQPALHDEGKKVLTAEEIAGAETDGLWAQGVHLGYPLLRAAGDELRERGVHFLDASGIFAGITERIYRDACHFGKRGNELLAEAIASALLEMLPGR